MANRHESPGYRPRARYLDAGAVHTWLKPQVAKRHESPGYRPTTRYLDTGAVHTWPMPQVTHVRLTLEPKCAQTWAKMTTACTLRRWHISHVWRPMEKQPPQQTHLLFIKEHIPIRRASRMGNISHPSATSIRRASRMGHIFHGQYISIRRASRMGNISPIRRATRMANIFLFDVQVEWAIYFHSTCKSNELDILHSTCTSTGLYVYIYIYLSHSTCRSHGQYIQIRCASRVGHVSH